MSIFGDIYDSNATAADIARGEAADRRAHSRKYNDSKRFRVEDLDDDTLVIKENGIVKEITIHPKAIANDVNNAKGQLMSDPKFHFLRIYFDKDIIFTYEVETACTDGIRIFFNPYYAHILLSTGNATLKEWVKSDESKALMKDEDKYNFAANGVLLKYIKFTLVHEAYHVYYNHVKRGAIKNKDDSEHNHIRANVAADIEINRDIESFFFDILGGSSDTMGLLWWKNDECFSKDGHPFDREIFETIYDNINDDIVNKMIDQLDSKNSNPTMVEEDDQKEQSALQKMYDNGYIYATDAINNETIDPLTF